MNMGKKSRLKMLGDRFLNKATELSKLKKDVSDKLKIADIRVVSEAKINTSNFMEWWKNTYPEEYLEVEGLTLLNKKIPQCVKKTLFRMNEWRKDLKY